MSVGAGIGLLALMSSVGGLAYFGSPPHAPVSPSSTVQQLAAEASSTVIDTRDIVVSVPGDGMKPAAVDETLPSSTTSQSTATSSSSDVYVGYSPFHIANAVLLAFFCCFNFVRNL